MHACTDAPAPAHFIFILISAQIGKQDDLHLVLGRNTMRT